MKPIKSFVGIATQNFSYYSGRFAKTKVFLILDLGFHVIITFHGSFVAPTSYRWNTRSLSEIKFYQATTTRIIMKHNPLGEYDASFV